MKTFLKIFILSIFCNYSFSQIYYSHYLDETSEWRVVEHHGEAGFHDFYFQTIFFDGYEDINGYTYYKMYNTYYNIGYDDIYSQIIFPQSNNSTLFLGYFREDSSGKFYIKYPSQNEIIYFDNQLLINSQVGDDFFDQFSYNADNCPVESIENINIFGLSSKIIKSSSNLEQGGSALEGVGMLFNFCIQPQYLDYSLATFKRVSSYKKQNEIYDFYNYHITTNSVQPLFYYSFPPANHQSLNVIQYNNFKLIVYPNPTKNSINFDNSKANFTTVILCNTLCQKITQQELNTSNNEQIDLSNFDNGIYFLKFSNENQTEIIKIVKE